MNARIIETRDKYVPVIFNGEKLHICANMAVIADIQEEFGDLGTAIEKSDAVESMAKLLRIFFEDAGLKMTEREIMKNLYCDSAMEFQKVIYDALRIGGYMKDEDPDPEEQEEEFDDSMVPDDEKEEKN